MKKIMFNDDYGLTQAVLEGRKTQTRRLIPYRIDVATDWKAFIEGDYKCVNDGYTGEWVDIRGLARYTIGEEVSIAQKYSECNRAVCLVDSKGWSNKMFVSADLMPHRIKITSVRVERLQDISEEDCLKEGIKRKNERYCVENYKGVCFYTNDPILALRCLIDKTCGKGTWNSNPWVFVYDFELIK